MSTTPSVNIILSSSRPYDPPNLHPTADLTSPQGHLPPVLDVSANRPTKRRRTSPRHTNMAAERASPSSDDSSQSGMADNETEAERSQLSERSAQQASPPQKKKRTRTLTTPHQSAVLHALLAKVPRFPSSFAIPTLLYYLPSPVSPQLPCEKMSVVKLA